MRFLHEIEILLSAAANLHQECNKSNIDFCLHVLLYNI